MGPGEPLDVGHFWLDRVVEYINFGADGVQFQQGTFGEAGEGVLPEVEFQHAGEVLPGGQVRGDVGFDVFCKCKFLKFADKNGEFCISVLEKVAGCPAGLPDAS